MSFSQGVNAGIAMSDASRRERHQQINETIQGFKKDSNGNMIPTEAGQRKLDAQDESVKKELIMLKTQNQMMQSILNEKSMTSGVLSLSSGNIRDGWNEIKKNPILLQQLQNGPLDVQEIAPIDFKNDKILLENIPDLRLDDEKLSKPEIQAALNSSLIKIRKRNGSWQIVPTQQIVKATGTLNYLDSKTKDQLIKRFNMITDIYKANHLLTSDEEKAKEISTALASESNQLKLDDLRAWTKANPNGSVADYLAHITPQEPAKAPTATEIQAMKDKQLADSMPEAEFRLNIKSEPLNEQTLARAKSIQEKPMSDTMNKEVSGRTNISQALIHLTNKLKTIDMDRNAIEKLRVALAKVNSPSATVGDTNKAINALKFNTELQAVVAEYVKFMSGAAVTDEEFQRYNDISQAGFWSSKEAAVASLEQFTDYMVSSAKRSIDSIAVPYPADYLLRREMFNKKLKDVGYEPAKSLPASEATAIKSTSVNNSGFMKPIKDFWNSIGR